MPLYKIHLDDISVEIPLQPQSYQHSVTAPTVPTMQSYPPTMLHAIGGAVVYKGARPVQTEHLSL